MTVLKIIRYLISTIRHKWFVFVAGIRFVKGIPIYRLILHDMSKFNPVEFVNYAKFYKSKDGKKDNKGNFVIAWMHHQKRNKHHPEYWTTHGVFEWANGSVDMPEIHVREWVADLLGASREYTGSWDMSDWLRANITRWDYCTPVTLALFSRVLYDLKYPVLFYDQTHQLIFGQKTAPKAKTP